MEEFGIVCFHGPSVEAVADSMFSMVQHLLCQSPFQACPSVLADKILFPAFLNTAERNFKMFFFLLYLTRLVTVLMSILEAVE